MTEVYNDEYWAPRPFEEKFWHMTFDWLEHFEPHSVLDYGCGMGYNVHCWRYYGVEAIGYDISQHAVEHAYKMAKGHTFNHLPEGQFDLVTNLDVLEHVPEQQAKEMLLQLYALTKPGGHCLMSICFSSDPNYPLDPTHCLKRTRKWWENQVTKAGFELCPVPGKFRFGNQMIIGRRKE